MQWIEIEKMFVQSHLKLCHLAASIRINRKSSEKQEKLWQWTDIVVMKRKIKIKEYKSKIKDEGKKIQ